MLTLNEDILDKLKQMRQSGYTKREAAKILTGTSLTTFNSAAKNAGLERAIRKIYPIHRTGPQAGPMGIKPPQNAQEAMATLNLNFNSLYVRAATMRWRSPFMGQHGQ